MWVCILPLFGVCEHCSGRWGAGVAKHRLRWGPQPRWKKQCRLGLKLGFPNSWASRSCWELWGVWMEGSCWWQAGAGEAGTQLNSEHHEAFSGRLRQQLSVWQRLHPRVVLNERDSPYLSKLFIGSGKINAYNLFRMDQLNTFCRKKCLRKEAYWLNPPPALLDTSLACALCYVTHWCWE